MCRSVHVGIIVFAIHPLLVLRRLPSGREETSRLSVHSFLILALAAVLALLGLNAYWTFLLLISGHSALLRHSIDYTWRVGSRSWDWFRSSIFVCSWTTLHSGGATITLGDVLLGGLDWGLDGNHLHH